MGASRINNDLSQDSRILMRPSTLANGAGNIQALGTEPLKKPSHPSFWSTVLLLCNNLFIYLAFNSTFEDIL